MKKIPVILSILMSCTIPLQAQHYLSLGLGFGTTFYSANDLDRFTETYNFVNRHNLASPLNGLDGAEGLRGEIGYRHLGRLSLAALAGLLSFGRRDFARYNNGEARNMKLAMRSFYVEYEMGLRRNNFFVNGLVTIFLNRQFTIESAYSTLAGEPTFKSLNGTYKSDATLSADVGITLGFFKDPIFLTGKITYPVFTGGKSNVLQDNRADKIADGTNVFPSDYIRYVNGTGSAGVGSDIDGLKILVSVAFAIPLNSI